MRWPLYAVALLLLVCMALWLQSYATALLGIVPLSILSHTDWL